MSEDKKFQISTDYGKSFKTINGIYDDEFSKSLSAIHDLTAAAIKEASHKFNLRLKKYIVDNLCQFGYVFSSDMELVDFLRERISRISFDGRPNYYELYLDLGEEDRGIFLGSYSDDIQIIENVASLTINFGKGDNKMNYNNLD
jgi:hypothetical protein